MNSDEYISFLKSVLIKIENAVNLIQQHLPKHIPAYRKILGVQQKLSELNQSDRSKLFPQIVKVRGIICYFMNGNYDEAHAQILRLKGDLVQICLEIENEKNTVKKT